jgi:hypothetical protein
MNNIERSALQYALDETDPESGPGEFEKAYNAGLRIAASCSECQHGSIPRWHEGWGRAHADEDCPAPMPCPDGHGDGAFANIVTAHDAAKSRQDEIARIMRNGDFDGSWDLE